LEKCILNVAENLPPDTEHLIVDGGSSDGTVGLLKELSERFQHLRWISEKDQGQSDAMNKGIRLAQGKWIGFLNADDFYTSGALVSVLAIIKSNPDKDRFLVGNLNIIDESDQLISVNKPSGMSLPALLADTCQWPYNPAAYFYPAALHAKIGYFPIHEHFAMDYDFILKLMMAGFPVEYQHGSGIQSVLFTG
jgi:glycosyltransferase involved in cell wall biosynthesis